MGAFDSKADAKSQMRQNAALIRSKCSKESTKMSDTLNARTPTAPAAAQFISRAR
jgi:hypothetical protein